MESGNTMQLFQEYVMIWIAGLRHCMIIVLFEENKMIKILGGSTYDQETSGRGVKWSFQGAS